MRLSAILLLGLLLRFFVAPWAPIHGNNHGIHDVRVLVVNGLDAVGKSGPYGDTFFVILNSLLSVLGKSDQVLFGLNALFGTLAIAGLYLLAKELRFSEKSALLAALFFCLSPSQVWLAGTESQMALHLCLGLAGLALLLRALKTASGPWLWTAAALLSVSAALHVITTPFLLVAAAVALSESRTGAAWPKGLRRHLAAALALSAGAIFLHARSIDAAMLLKGLGGFDGPSLLKAWASSSNILWDPTLTPAALPVLALAGAVLMRQHRPEQLRTLVLAAVLLIPLSFSVSACRTDALRYQAPTHWLLYLLAAFPFSVPMKPAREVKLVRAACLLVAATALPGLLLLKDGDEYSREYRFMRQVAERVGPTTFLWLPTRTATRLAEPEFPDYVNGLPLLRGLEPYPFDGSDGRLAYLGLDCYLLFDGEDEAQTFDAATGLRRECAAACAGSKTALLETTLDARPARWGFQKRYWRRSRPQPVIGLYRCRTQRRAGAAPPPAPRA